MAYVKRNSEANLCLQCGTPLYGRKDKRFCSQDCKDRWHYVLSADSRRYRRRVLMNLELNYTILEDLLESGITTIDRIDVEVQGFTPGIMTGYTRKRGTQDEVRCFDISYNITEVRLSHIKRIKKIKPPAKARSLPED